MPIPTLPEEFIYNLVVGEASLRAVVFSAKCPPMEAAGPSAASLNACMDAITCAVTPPELRKIKDFSAVPLPVVLEVVDALPLTSNVS